MKMGFNDIFSTGKNNKMEVKMKVNIDQKNSHDTIQKIVREIRENHLKIIDDWSKAYLAKEYHRGNGIHPENFHIIERQGDITNNFTSKYEIEPAWNYDASEMRLGFNYLATLWSGDVTSIYVQMDLGITGALGQKLELDDVRAWRYLPEAAPRKTHFCKEGSVKCESREDENLYLTEYRDYEWCDVSWVRHCPFCGEESNNAKTIGKL